MIRVTLVFAAMALNVALGAGAELRPPFEPLSLPKPGAACSSIAVLPDGTWMTTAGNAALVSRDHGRSWGEPRPIVTSAAVDAKGPGIPGGSAQLVRTRAGTLVLVWRDERVLDWDEKAGEPRPDSHADVWTIHSRDGGRTWSGRERIFAGVCGHPPITVIQTRAGQLVVPVQFYVTAPGRNVIRSYVSSDDGATWRGGNIIDLGGHGHHDGAFEPALVELRDGRVWMLIRTNWDRFWEAFSEDGGLTWRTIRPSSISASSSPPYVLRLASGRLLLLWNRLYPEGATSYARRAAPFSEVAGSWHREELSAALSDDDGQTWSPPHVVARARGKWLAYGVAFEPEPGVIWIRTGQGNIAAQTREADLLPTSH